MLEPIINLKPELEKVIERFQAELAVIRTGRATPALVENILINYYNGNISLKEMAAISIPEPRQIVIKPWDNNALEMVEKGIRNSDLGINPIVDGHLIRVVLPPMTEEYRKKLIKLIGTKAEEARIAARRLRDECGKKIQELERTGRIREDEKFKGKQELQKVIDEMNKEIEEIAAQKKEEITIV